MKYFLLNNIIKTKIYKVMSILFIIGFVACQQGTKNSDIAKKLSNNLELKQLYQEDQNDRQSENINWKIVSKNDRLREARVYELLDSDKVVTSLDYSNAAMIFQHGSDSIASGMAVKMMKKSIELDSTAEKWLLAAAIDRDLSNRNKPQIYGTQYVKNGESPWELYKIDTTIISDSERIDYHVETLSEQREKVIKMNKKKITSLLSDGKTIAEIIDFVKIKGKLNLEYDFSEDEINIFGYNLMAQGNYKDALRIFKLNTELNPNGSNAFDSYGECLMKLGLFKEAITAYEKSLELNPNNSNAEKMLSELKN